MQCSNFCSLLLLPGVQLTIEIQASCTSNTLKDFKLKLEDDAAAQMKLSALQAEVQEFAHKFPMPGYDDV